jgi:hypothetical protein
MIGFVGLAPPDVSPADSVVLLAQLPAPPANHIDGFCVRCQGERSLAAVLQWYEQLRTRRPDVPLALICDDTAESFRLLASEPYRLSPVLLASELSNDTVPGWVLDELRAGCVPDRIMAEWCDSFALTERSPDLNHLLSALIQHAIRGGTVEHAARKLGTSRRTVLARLHRVCPCSPKCLLTTARLRAVGLERFHGVQRRDAFASVFYATPKAYESALRRHRRLMLACKRVRGGCPLASLGRPDPADQA